MVIKTNKAKKNCNVKKRALNLTRLPIQSVKIVFTLIVTVGKKLGRPNFVCLNFESA